MEPLTTALVVAGGAQVLSGVMQWLGSRQAQRASSRERQRMIELAEKLQLPNFDLTQISPEEYDVLWNYVPEVIPVVDEVAPTQVKMQSAAAQEAIGAQRDVLGQLLQAAREGEDPISRLELLKGQLVAGQEARGAQENALSEMRRRGLGADSGVALQMQMGNQANALNRLALSGAQNAADRFQARQGALRDAGSLAGSMRASEFDQERTNAGIVNAWNERLARNRQNIAAQNVNARNDAAMKREDMRQRIHEGNVAMRNEARFGERDRRDRLTQQMFGNARDKTALMTGQYAGRIDDIMSAAGARNQAYQGLGDAFSSIATYWAGAQDRKADRLQRDRDRDMWREWMSKNKGGN